MNAATPSPTLMKRPDPRRSPLPFHVGLRLSGDQYRAALAYSAAHGVSVSAAVRSMIDEWAAANPEAVEAFGDPFAGTPEDQRALEELRRRFDLTDQRAAS